MDGCGQHGSDSQREQGRAGFEDAGFELLVDLGHLLFDEFEVLEDVVKLLGDQRGRLRRADRVACLLEQLIDFVVGDLAAADTAKQIANLVGRAR